MNSVFENLQIFDIHVVGVLVIPFVLILLTSLCWSSLFGKVRSVLLDGASLLIKLADFIDSTIGHKKCKYWLTGITVVDIIVTGVYLICF